MEKNNDRRKFLFNVDIMIEAETSGLALEQLLRIMNESKLINDYEIKSGIALGQQIQQALEQTTSREPIAELQQQSSKAASGQASDVRIHDLIAKNTLIRLTVLKGKGVKLSIPCRIVAYDSVLQFVTVYHVDEKKVYQFRLNEIEEFTVS